MSIVQGHNGNAGFISSTVSLGRTATKKLSIVCFGSTGVYGVCSRCHKLFGAVTRPRLRFSNWPAN